MRSVLIIAFIIVYVIVMLPALLVFNIKAKSDPVKTERYVFKCMSWLFKGITFIAGTKIVVNGLENVPTDIPVLYAANHTSWFDIIFTYPLSPLATSYVAKSELKKVPFFSVWGRLMRCIFFNKDDIKSSLGMISEATENLKSGTSVFIFPEGTRNKNEGYMPLNTFHDGSFKCAVRSGAPVVPVAIKFSGYVWDAQYPWVVKRTVSITYGKPVYVKELSADEKKHIGAHIQGIVTEMLLSS